MILLTDGERNKAIGQGGKDWLKAGSPIYSLHEFEDRAIAKAAVKKVVEWIEDRGIVASPPIPDINFKLESGDLWLSKHDWQTLKKEVEDGLE